MRNRYPYQTLVESVQRLAGRDTLQECERTASPAAAGLEQQCAAFFPDSDDFQYLERHVLPQLLRERESLRVWCCGCGHGGVIYSVAMLLRELAPDRSHWVLGTEPHTADLARARRGSDYTAAEVQSLSLERRRRFFDVSTDGAYSAGRELRALLDFRPHAHSRSAPARDLDLIIYPANADRLDERARRQLCDRLVAALRPGGELFIGQADLLAIAPRPGIVRYGSSFFRRAAESGFAFGPEVGRRQYLSQLPQAV